MDRGGNFVHIILKRRQLRLPWLVGLGFDIKKKLKRFINNDKINIIEICSLLMKITKSSGEDEEEVWSGLNLAQIGVMIKGVCLLDLFSVNKTLVFIENTTIKIYQRASQELQKALLDKSPIRKRHALDGSNGGSKRKKKKKNSEMEDDIFLRCVVEKNIVPQLEINIREASSFVEEFGEEEENEEFTAALSKILEMNTLRKSKKTQDACSQEPEELTLTDISTITEEAEKTMMTRKRRYPIARQRAIDESIELQMCTKTSPYYRPALKLETRQMKYFKKDRFKTLGRTIPSFRLNRELLSPMWTRLNQVKGGKFSKTHEKHTIPQVAETEVVVKSFTTRGNQIDSRYSGGTQEKASTFEEFVEGFGRKEKAFAFASLLNMQKRRILKLHQQKPFSTIYIKYI